MPHWGTRPYNNDKGTIAGWGKAGQAEWQTNLKEVDVAIWTEDFCRGIMNHKWQSSQWQTITKYNNLSEFFFIVSLRSNLCSGVIHRDTGSGVIDGSYQLNFDMNGVGGTPCDGDRGTSLMYKENDR